MKILFICHYNVGRSQMAEAFLKKLKPETEIKSAGTKINKNGEAKTIIEISDLIPKCMQELGFDISKNIVKQLTPKMITWADKVIVMAEKETWPDILKKSDKVEFWPVPDALNRPYEFHCQIRDQIKNLVEKLAQKIK